MAENKDSMAKVAAILGTVATLLVAFNTWQVSQFDADLRQVESERELNFRIYQSIADSIESGKHQRIRAVRVLVNALATKELRKSYLSVLETGEVQIWERQEAILSGPAELAGTPRTNWRDWNYDIFWCSSSGAGAEAQANAIVAAIQAAGAEGRIRSRILPDSIRADDPYKSTEQYEVRFEASEETQATQVAELAGRAIGQPGSFNLRRIEPSKPTPWYVSVFACPETSAD